MYVYILCKHINIMLSYKIFGTV